MVDQKKIEGVKTVVLEYEGKKILPDPNCRKCYGRGYAAFYSRTSQPIPCVCLRKQLEEAKRDKFQRLIGKKVNPAAIDFDADGKISAGQTKGMSLEEIKKRYPEQYAKALEKMNKNKEEEDGCQAKGTVDSGLPGEGVPAPAKDQGD